MSSCTCRTPTPRNREGDAVDRRATRHPASFTHNKSPGVRSLPRRPLDEGAWFGSDDASHESGEVSQQIEVLPCIV